MIRKDTDHAMRLLLAIYASPMPSSAGRLCRRLRVPRDFAQKILRRLCRASILRASRGPRGGFFPVARPQAVTLLDIVTAVQGPPILSPCLRASPSCPRRRRCGVRGGLARLQDQLEAGLRDIRLADLMDSTGQAQ